MAEIKSWGAVLKIVEKDCKVNFLARATTPWNAISIDALLYFFQNKGIKIRAIVAIDEHPVGGYMIDESFFVNRVSRYYKLPYSSDKIRTENLEKDSLSNGIKPLKLFHPRSVYINRDNPLYYSTYNQNMPDVTLVNELRFLHRKIVVCRTEEGVGAYMGTFDKTYQSLAEVSSLGEFKGYFVSVILGKYLYRICHNNYDSLTLHRRFGKWFINRKIIPFYNRVFEEKNTFTHYILDRKELQSSIIICTTAWRRNEIVDNEDLRVLHLVCQKLFKAGYHILLKTHPRDSFFEQQAESLQCSILKASGLTMECLCQYSQPKAMISFSSTTLVNAKIFWNIPVFCISDLLDRSKISDFYLDEIDSFKRTFKSLVYFCKNEDEVLDKLSI